MKYKIDDIIKAGNYNSTDWQNVFSFFKNSEKYKDKISSHPIKGTLIEGDMNEILADLNAGLSDFLVYKDEQESLKAAEKERLEEERIGGENKVLLNTISRLKDVLPNGTEYYEYKTIVIKDSEILGTVDAEKIQLTLNKLALEGWRLKTAITNEIGHNRAVVVNATINNTVLILERLVIKE